MKYSLVAEILETGANVLLSDTDIMFLDNPFCFLHRDSDVEAQTDGGDAVQAYGYFEMVNEPPLFAPWRQIVYFLNAGFFYTRASSTTISVMRAIADRLAVEDIWDQAAFNDELWRPRSPLNSWGRSAEMATSPADSSLETAETAQPVSAAVAEKLAWLQRYKARTAVGGRFPRVRVLDLLRFPNSKVALHHYDKLYTSASDAVCPAVVHANYHANKVDTLKTAQRLFEHCVVNSDRTRCAPPPTATLEIPVAGAAGNGGPQSDAVKLRHAASFGASVDQRSVLAESSWELPLTSGLRPHFAVNLAKEQLAAALAAETARGRLQQVPASVRDDNWE